MMNVSSTIAGNPMNSIAGLTSFMPAPSYSSTISPFSSNYSNLQNQGMGNQEPVLTNQQGSENSEGQEKK